MSFLVGLLYSILIPMYSVLSGTFQSWLSKLRVSASTSNIAVVLVDPDFINSRNAMTIGKNSAKHAGLQLMVVCAGRYGRTYFDHEGGLGNEQEGGLGNEQGQGYGHGEYSHMRTKGPPGQDAITGGVTTSTTTTYVTPSSTSTSNEPID